MNTTQSRRSDVPGSSTGRNILALNSGSSSLKFGLYSVGSGRPQALLSGEAESIGDGQGPFHAKDSLNADVLRESAAFRIHAEAVARILQLLADCRMPAPSAVGHRVVHGGPALRQHCLIDDSVLTQLQDAAAFAPLHAPAALSVIRHAREHFPGIPQVACFDTAFHAGLPDVARVLPLAGELRSEGIQRYGFHGLSCESIVRQIGESLPDRLIIAHLGNGASVTAIQAGRSIDTSMGLTPAGGVMMGTRTGDLDPGVLVHLMRAKKLDAAMIEELVDRRSGLLGVSRLSGDMRILRAAPSSNTDAQLAIRMFCYSVCKQIAAMIAALDGADAIVFTGGIGENDADTRTAICSGLSWMGIRLDAARNRLASNPISSSASRCQVLVLPAREDEEIARQTCHLTRGIA